MRVVAAFLGSLAIACGPTSPPPVVALTAPSAATTAPAPPPATPASLLGLPRGSPLTLAVDLSALDTPAVRAALLEIASEVLRVPAAAVEERVRAAGVDTHRSVAVAIAPLSAEQRRLVDRLHPMLPRGGPPAADAVDAAMAELARSSRPVCVRVVIPATDASLLARSVRDVLRGDGWHEDTPGDAGHESLFVLGGDARSVTLDLASGREAHAALEDLAADLRAASEEAPALKGRTARLTYAPRALADVSFVMNTQKIQRAISGGNVDPAMVQPIFTQGLLESSQAYALAADASDRPYFDRVDLEATVDFTALEIALHATEGPGLQPPADGLWMPSPSVGLERAWARLSVSRPWMSIWHLVARDLVAKVRDAGFLGYYIALPTGLTSLAASAPELLGAPSRWAGLVLERQGVEAVGPQGVAVFVGQLPDGVDLAGAQCLFAGKAPCPSKTRLSLTSIIEDHGTFARLVANAGRFTVLMSTDRDALAGPVRVSMEAPLSLRATSADAASLLGVTLPAGFPARLTAQVERRGNVESYVVHGGP